MAGDCCAPLGLCTFFVCDPRAALVPRLPWAGLRQAFGLIARSLILGLFKLPQIMAKSSQYQLQVPQSFVFGWFALASSY